MSIVPVMRGSAHKCDKQVKLNEYYHHAMLNIYHSHGVRGNRNVKVFATYRHWSWHRLTFFMGLKSWQEWVQHSFCRSDCPMHTTQHVSSNLSLREHSNNNVTSPVKLEQFSLKLPSNTLHMWELATPNIFGQPTTTAVYSSPLSQWRDTQIPNWIH